MRARESPGYAEVELVGRCLEGGSGVCGCVSGVVLWVGDYDDARRVPGGEWVFEEFCLMEVEEVRCERAFAVVFVCCRGPRLQ